MKLLTAMTGIFVLTTSMMILPAFGDKPMPMGCSLKSEAECVTINTAAGCKYSVGEIHHNGDSDANVSWLNYCQWNYKDKNYKNDIAAANADIAAANADIVAAKADNDSEALDKANQDLMNAELALAVARKGKCEEGGVISTTIAPPYRCSTTDDKCMKQLTQTAKDC